MHQSTLSTAGRVVYAVPFLVFGAFHLMNSSALAAMVPSLFPGAPVFWVVLTGIAFIAAAAALLAGRYVREASLLIAFHLLVFVLTIWLPQLGAEGQQGQMAMSSLLKDTALFGAALYLAGIAGAAKPSHHHHTHTHASADTA